MAPPLTTLDQAPVSDVRDVHAFSIRNGLHKWLESLYYVLFYYMHTYTQPIEVAIRRLNELGVLTVFVILDSLSKVSAAYIICMTSYL